MVSFFLRPSVSLLLSLLFIEQILFSNLFGADGFTLSLISCGGSSGGGVFFSSSDVGSAAALAFSFRKFSLLRCLFLDCILVCTLLFLIFPRFSICLSHLAVVAFLHCFASNGGGGG